LTDVAANTEPVRFDHEAAERLAARFRATAAELRNQVSSRRAFEADAKQEWRGVYSEKFTERMNICTQDAERFAQSMLLAASQLDELSRLAREEQARRDRAREWEEHERNEGLREKFVDFVLQRDDRPPMPDPVDPPRFTIQAPTAASTRG